jgi:hypothetical protein
MKKNALLKYWDEKAITFSETKFGNCIIRDSSSSGRLYFFSNPAYYKKWRNQILLFGLFFSLALAYISQGDRGIFYFSFVSFPFFLSILFVIPYQLKSKEKLFLLIDFKQKYFHWPSDTKIPFSKMAHIYQSQLTTVHPFPSTTYRLNIRLKSGENYVLFTVDDSTELHHAAELICSKTKLSLQKETENA